MILNRIINYIRWNIDEMQGKKKIVDIYDSLALQNKYEDLVDYNSRVKNIQEALQQIKNNYSQVLDLGCGTGALIDAMPNQENLKITGIDFSAEMLTKAEKRFQKYPNIKLIHSSFMDVDFPSNTFDLITIANAIRFVPQGQEKIFAKNIANWIKKDGMFLIYDMSFFWQPIFLPIIAKVTKGSNLAVSDVANLEKMLTPFFILDCQKTIGWQAGIFKINAYYFRRV